MKHFRRIEASNDDLISFYFSDKMIFRLINESFPLLASLLWTLLATFLVQPVEAEGRRGGGGRRGGSRRYGGSYRRYGGGTLPCLIVWGGFLQIHEFTNDVFHVEEFTNEKKPIPTFTSAAMGLLCCSNLFMCGGSRSLEYGAIFLSTHILRLAVIALARLQKCVCRKSGINQ